MSETKPKPAGLALMREPFSDNQISKMCRSTKKENPKGTCKKCGGYHGLPSVQLSYVGHAALTDRLLEADPNWNWEPVAVDEHGFPHLDKDGGMWIKLTVCGVTRLGYGDNQNQTGGNATKERIGDALRNAAMRFGAALDLWHKGDLHRTDGDGSDEKQESNTQSAASATQPSGNGHDVIEKAYQTRVDEYWRWFKGQHAEKHFMDTLGAAGYEKASEVPADRRVSFFKALDDAKEYVKDAAAAREIGNAHPPEAIDFPISKEEQAEFEGAGI